MPKKDKESISTNQDLNFEDFQKQVLDDFYLACLSREASLLGRKEVLTGKAKFGIFGDGKEIAQIALAKAFKPGDFRSGYYRDQTLAFATGMSTVKEFFAQLYADTDIEKDPASAGRQMNAHFATRSLGPNGEWKDLTKIKNTAADSSPTASQMARGVGLALASKVYRQVSIQNSDKFSRHGNEVCFATIGDASTSEGIFWESLNAAGVMQIPLAISVWDDGYGISVPKKYQTTKGSISAILAGFNPEDEDGTGIDIYKGKGWDYPGLIELYTSAIARMRETHRPAVFHIEEVTQPQGHSTSGSHERYKSRERLNWEEEWDCIPKMQEWMVSSAITTDEECEQLREKAIQDARQAQKEAWKAYQQPIKNDLKTALDALYQFAESGENNGVNEAYHELKTALDPIRKDIVKAYRRALYASKGTESAERQTIQSLLQTQLSLGGERYHSHLYSEGSLSARNIPIVKAEYNQDSPLKNGFEILNIYFDGLFDSRSDVVAFGEDLGKIGDVNQGFAGLQEKYGEHRIWDTGIREATIIGQGIGLAMRGIRPIAEIQYLDYLLYGFQPIVDDLATLQYRTKGGQKAPMIVRTRGHRLEGIWHTGSPMGMILHSCRGIYVWVPRNMTQAAGMYNTMLQSDEPALIIECLNGYRLKEKLPLNLDSFTVKPGMPEILKQGSDVTLVTYGSCVRIAQEGISLLEEQGISVELIDVQCLLPFDTDHVIAESLKKTNRIMFMDEDVPGGATAFMMQKVLQEQDGYHWLDSKPVCLSAYAHRSPYASDGDYFSKPNAEDVFETVYALMHEADPSRFA